MARPGSEASLSERLCHLRQTVFGQRGRAAFARAVGVSPSTYNYYEKGRPPPTGLLARAAEVTGADLTWLVTGRGEPFPDGPPRGCDIGLSHPLKDILDRFASGGGTSPQDAAARSALRRLLAEMQQALPPAAGAWEPHRSAPTRASIPIVGRTAAGILASWEEHFSAPEDPDVLEHLLRQVEGASARRRGAALAPADPQAEGAQPQDRTAMLTQLSSPTPDGVAEFLDLPGVGPVEPGTFALRVDGDSMAPRIRDGDLVVSRRGAGPEPGRTAIVKVRHRIGVTVKIWQPQGDRVHLIPVNESYELAVYPRSEVLWACRVLWVVRL